MSVVDENLQLINTAIQKPVQKLAPIQWVGIKKLRYAGKADVYNMEVDAHHNFSVNGGLIVHNCMDAMRYAMQDVIYFKPEKGEDAQARYRKLQRLSHFQQGDGLRQSDFKGGWS